MPPTRAVPQSMHTKCTCAVPRHGQLPPHFAAGNEAAARELAGCHGKFAVLDLAATDDVTDADIVGGSQKGHRRAGLPQRTPKGSALRHRRTFPEIAKPAQRSAIGPPRIKGVSGIGRILLEAGRGPRRSEAPRARAARSPGVRGPNPILLPGRQLLLLGCHLRPVLTLPTSIIQKGGKNRPLVDFIGFFCTNSPMNLGPVICWARDGRHPFRMYGPPPISKWLLAS